MSLENPIDKDAGRRPTISPEVRRALVFLLLGPVLGAIVAWLVVAAMTGGKVDLYGIRACISIQLDRLCDQRSD